MTDPRDASPRWAGRVFGFAGYSGAGKTTLLEQVVRHLVGDGRRVSVVKHAHERFDADRPGKDSYRHREAGASEVLLTSPHRWALLHESRGEAEPPMAEQLARLSPCDLILVEGYKHWPIPKVEVWRPATGKPRLAADPWIVAVATDAAGQAAGPLPVLDINDARGVADWVCAYLRRPPSAEQPEEKRE